jgi:formylglycine-generating enzyme required for sulfatase activity
MRTQAILLSGSATLLLIACGAFTRIDPDLGTNDLRTDSGGADAKPIDGSPSDADSTIDASMQDASMRDSSSVEASVADAASDASDAGPKRCPDDMVPVLGLYCIDKFEVSRDKYDAFYKNSGGVASLSDNRCAWKADYHALPSGGASDGLKPIDRVDFCDALGYCKRNGKRLCGLRTDGGQSRNEWTTACEQENRLFTVEGQAVIAASCNIARTPPLSHWNTTSSTCHTAAIDLYDMLGNVNEWTDVTTTFTVGAPASDKVEYRGGASTNPKIYACNGSGYSGFRTYADPEVGIRCCADIPK